MKLLWVLSLQYFHMGSMEQILMNVQPLCFYINTMHSSHVIINFLLTSWSLFSASFLSFLAGLLTINFFDLLSITSCSGMDEWWNFTFSVCGSDDIDKGDGMSLNVFHLNKQQFILSYIARLSLTFMFCWSVSLSLHVSHLFCFFFSCFLQWYHLCSIKQILKSLNAFTSTQLLYNLSQQVWQVVKLDSSM